MYRRGVAVPPPGTFVITTGLDGLSTTVSALRMFCNIHSLRQMTEMIAPRENIDSIQLLVVSND